MSFLFWKRKDRQQSLYEKIDLKRVPTHVAIIMDGNGRWAKSRNLPRVIGHRAGVEAIKEIVKASSELGVKVLTLYAFSTENWKRPADEVSSLMKLLVEFLRKETKELDDNNVNMRCIGDISKLPVTCQQELHKSFDITSNNTGLILNIALNYGGRAEIVNAVKAISKRVKDGTLKIENIDENTISSFLYTSKLPDPDLIIRPSGELRLSNFLLWQGAYSELWFSNINWPDFDRENYYRAIIDYQKRDRRFGGIKD
ncbi:MAG TPA: isoprenyl transferase [Clostridiaceae bacterium]|nr:isoprenyl transferase [Clostridiaceae bacterium]